jgi:D-beta-D-heptose 7-phosphate kinase/D-beta-D-heptose 1-phosphate adenosyltransferase
VAVIGDIILDEYIIGDTERISPEAPAPVIMEHSRHYVPGGAANVVVNIACLGANARLFGTIGDDPEGSFLRNALRSRGLDDSGIMTLQGRPTTRKTRVIARGNQMLRIDKEITGTIDCSVEKKLIKSILDSPEKVVIVSDYAKGTVTSDMVRVLAKAGKYVIADPKSADFSKYSHASIVTPNLNELSLAAGIPHLSPADIEQHAHRLMKAFSISCILVTAGPDGMYLVEKNERFIHEHARTREVYDVTGAGDTVIAALASVIGGGASPADACYIANIAAGIVVGKPQTATTTPQEIMSYVFGASASDKIIDIETLLERLRELRSAGRKIVFTNGCFDLLHVGHITYLNEARGLGDILVVGLNTDRSVRALKGPSRPVIPEEERSHLLAALECVDFVILFDEDTPLKLIEKVRPDYLVKGADYSREKVVGHDIVESYGGKVCLLPLVNDTSTTSIINRIKGQY